MTWHGWQDMTWDGMTIPDMAWHDMTWNYMDHIVRDDLTYPFANLHGGNIEIWKWICKFIQHLLGMWLLIHAGIKILKGAPRGYLRRTLKQKLNIFYTSQVRQFQPPHINWPDLLAHIASQNIEVPPTYTGPGNPTGLQNNRYRLYIHVSEINWLN